MPRLPGSDVFDPDQQARDVLASALAKSGAQDAAHTARENARQRAAEEQRRAAERAGRLRSAAPAVSADHAAMATLLTQRQQEWSQLGDDLQRHRRQLHEVRLKLGRTPRWSGSRRRELETTIDYHDDALERSLPIHAQLSAEIENLSSQAARHALDRQAPERVRTRRPRRRRGHPASRAKHDPSRQETVPMSLLNVDQAAETLGTSPRFIRRLIAERRIVFTELGKHVRIDSNDLDAFIAGGRVEPDDQDPV